MEFTTDEEINEVVKVEANEALIDPAKTAGRPLRALLKKIRDNVQDAYNNLRPAQDLGVGTETTISQKVITDELGKKVDKADGSRLITAAEAEKINSVVAPKDHFGVWLETHPGGTFAQYEAYFTGKSAFALWQQDNPGGTYAAYLQSNKGAPGLSHFDIWLLTNPGGTPAQYDEYYKGQDGTDGTGINILGLLDRADLDGDGVPDALPCWGEKGDAYLVPNAEQPPRNEIWVWVLPLAKYVNMGAFGAGISEAEAQALINTALQNYYTKADIALLFNQYLGNYFTKDEVNTAINTAITAALATRYTNAEIDSFLAAINAIIGSAGGDGDTVVNTVREMLIVFQNYAEGVDIAQQFNNFAASLGTLSGLTTVDKSNIVAAINELVTKVNNASTTDTKVTALTFDNNTLTLKQNGQTDITVTITAAGGTVKSVNGNFPDPEGNVTVAAGGGPDPNSHVQNTDTGTDKSTWNFGAAITAGLVRVWEMIGSAANISAKIKLKGAGKLLLEGVSYVTAAEKVLVINPAGEILAQYLTAEEQVAVPASLATAGIPGTWATDNDGFLYFCKGASGWLKFGSVGAALAYLEQWVAIPATPTSPGQPGQKAYDSINDLMYECPAVNTWIRYAITKTW